MFLLVKNHKKTALNNNEIIKIYRQSGLPNLNIAHIDPSTMVLGPGLRAAVWVQGCLMDCPKCMAPEWQPSISAHIITPDKLARELISISEFTGITISGGEPMLQPEWVAKFLKKLKENGLTTALDTCGHVSIKAYEKVLPYVDLMLYDIKEIDDYRHRQFTGVSNELILKNAIWLTKKLKADGKQIWIRTPIIPKYTATAENVRGIATFILEELGNQIDRWDLLAFNVLPGAKYDRMDMAWEFKNEQLFTKEEMEQFYNIALEMGVNNVQWSGMTRKE